MSLLEWVYDAVLAVVVIRQLRTRTYTVNSVLVPIALVALATLRTLRVVPVADVGPSIAAAAVGVLLGLASAALTRVEVRTGIARVRASVPSALVWLLGLGIRLFVVIGLQVGQQGLVQDVASAVGVSSPHGAVTVTTFLVVGEVAARVALLTARVWQAAGHPPPPNAGHALEAVARDAERRARVADLTAHPTRIRPGAAG